jgi:hypothetical protein
MISSSIRLIALDREEPIARPWKLVPPGLEGGEKVNILRLVLAQDCVHACVFVSVGLYERRWLKTQMTVDMRCSQNEVICCPTVLGV